MILVANNPVLHTATLQFFFDEIEKHRSSIILSECWMDEINVWHTSHHALVVQSSADKATEVSNNLGVCAKCYNQKRAVSFLLTINVILRIEWNFVFVQGQFFPMQR